MLHHRKNQNQNQIQTLTLLNLASAQTVESAAVATAVEVVDAIATTVAKPTLMLTQHPQKAL